MNTWAVFWIGLFALLAFGRLVSEVGSVMRARAYGRGGPCPCSAVTSIAITPGIPAPGSFGNLAPGTPEDAARKVH